jgi:hypothetical protein
MAKEIDMQRIFKQQSSEPKGGELGISGIGGGRNLRWPRLLAATLALVGLLRGPADLHGSPAVIRRNSGGGSSLQELNPVVQWNKTLLVIVRTHGAQPVTIHPTHSFALMHAAMYDAVNTIETTHNQEFKGRRAA